MPDVTPTGPVSVAVDALRTLIATIPWFQTWTGTASVAAAKARIFTGEVGFPIASVSIARGVITITTRDTHNIPAGAVVEIAGSAVGPESSIDVDGPQTVTNVTTKTLLVATALGDLAAVYPDQAFVVPCIRPMAVVSEATDGVHADSIGTGGASVYAGTLEILLEADTSTAYANDPLNSLYEARNAFGSFVQGLANTQGTADLMCLNKIEPISGPEFTAKPEQDDNSVRFERWRALVRVTWGLEG